MSALGTILDQMATQIRTAVAAGDWDIMVEPRMVLNPSGPMVDMYPADPARDGDTRAFGAESVHTEGGYWINVRARVATVDHVANQDVLLALKDDEDPICLVQALYDDPTLNGHAADVNLESETGFAVFPTIDGAGAHLGVLWRFLVIPARS